MTEEKDNSVKIGGKSSEVYLMAVNRGLNENEEVVLKARGHRINDLVNIAERAKREFKAEATDISIGTEKAKNKETDREFNVSAMSITLKKLTKKDK